MKPRINLIALCMFTPLLLLSEASGASLPLWVVDNGPKWQPPKEGVVRDAATAITIAHAIWVSMNPEMSAQIGPEEVWRPALQATLRDGVWEVTRKSEDKVGPGGALFIYISRLDGRIMSINLTQ